MNKTKKRIASLITASALLLNFAGPAFAGTTLMITGNADGSDNDVVVTVGSTTVVTQTNYADIDNNVDAHSNTGDNTASRNNGGDVVVDTGDADVDVAIVNMANSNTAEIDGCCDVDTEAVIEGNAGDTDNDIKVTNGNAVVLWQDNVAKVDNNVHAGANSGGNVAGRNNGGAVVITTGNASVADMGVVINNTLNSNWARVGADGSGDGLFSARIVGNGFASQNTINANVGKSLVLTQFNKADVDNNVKAHADSGNNRANRNSGGAVLIDTGDADVDVYVDTAANFNWADSDCGCTIGALAKIAGNAGDTDNDIRATLGSELSVFQDNVYACEKMRGLNGLMYMMMGKHGYGRDCNNVNATADTGDSSANRNNGGVDSDPGVITGDADTNVEVVNTGNSNSFGVSTPAQWWGEMDPMDLSGFGFNFNLSFSLADLMGLLG